MRNNARGEVGMESALVGLTEGELGKESDDTGVDVAAASAAASALEGADAEGDDTALVGSA
jgi:hypothetical protein